MSRLYKKKKTKEGRGSGQSTENCTRAKGHMIKLKGNALWTNKRKSFFIQSIVNLPNSQPQGVIETNAVAGFQSRPDNFMSLIKIRSPGSSDNDKGNQTPSCSLWDGVGGMGKEPGCPQPAGQSLLGAHLPLKRRALPTTDLLWCHHSSLLGRNKTWDPSVSF